MNSRALKSYCGAILLTLCCFTANIESQGSARLGLPVTLRELLSTAGPKLEQLGSDRFMLYSELPRSQTSTILDSLQEAFAHSTALLGAELPEATPVPVIVTTSRTRFAPLLSPSTKGFRGVLADGSSIIVLVVNDSVRPYTRHEVMHDVSFKLWGAAHEGGGWMSEALATYADGRCQNVPNIVVARDLLKKKPTLTMEELAKRFWDMSTLDRHGTYVLGASVIEFLWQSGGRETVRRVWQKGEWPSASAPGGSPFAADLNSRWRSYVARTAGTRVGLDPDRLRRNGCG
jgi:hypothetical protein